MKPNVYYEIPTDRYLFNKSEKPEEKIRQWVLFELLTTFGVNINNIQVEVPVKVGTRTHYADIVIYDNKKPIVVIECKRKEDNKPENSTDQAISYASSKEINAVYAISTNGKYWNCSKKINNEWSNVLEIPKFSRIENDNYQRIESVMIHLHEFKYIAKYFFETIAEDNVEDFFNSLQNFHVGNPFERRINSDLFNGADYLMKVVTHGPLVKREYDEGNLGAAFSSFTKYALDNGILESERLIKYPDMLDAREKIINLIFIFDIVQKKSVVKTLEIKLCLVVHSMLRYLLECLKKDKRLSYSARDVYLIQDYIDSSLKEQIGLRLPKDNEDLLEFNVYCRHQEADDFEPC